MMAPTAHSGLPAKPGDNAYLRHFGDQQTSNAITLAEKLRFFDRHVRGIRNGFENEPPVLIYVMGEGWRREDEWPLKRARNWSLSLSSGGALVDGKVPAGEHSWQVDPRASSLSQDANRWNYGIASVRAPLSLDAGRAHRLEYTSAPLPAAREITGHPVVRIELGANVPSTDVYAYLEDVAPDGTSLLVSEGQLRADFHRLRPAQGIASAGAKLRVKPALPYHGYRQSDHDPAPLADGRTVRLEFDLMPVAWVFKAGHRIRLSLAGADEGTFQSRLGAGGNVIWRVRTGRGASELVLPWVGAH
jgi:putative CocE/NonD family hydrolase